MRGVVVIESHSTDQSNLFWPGDADPDQITDDEHKAFTRGRALPIFYPTSSARIGPAPETGVVDASLRVYGVQGLRIWDFSVFLHKSAAIPPSSSLQLRKK
ncbi:hypothetical protein BJY52DRAFT_1188340 [Lactarius psammicola]|nr:hypothetical protein BJY52DRAFT_1188340 [Lactarius psammicola]